MNLRTHNENESQAIVQLFASVFAESAGESEGALIGKLAADLFEKIDAGDLFNFVAEADDQIVGSIFFSRLNFEDQREAFMLAPVAVHSDWQRRGIGQALINHGLRELKTRGVRTVLTYGDPAYYQKVGFCLIQSERVKAPFELSQPEGWLGQSLTQEPIEALSGRCACVEAFNNPAYW